MLTTYQARAGDVRALAGAVVFGSVVGLLIGGSYLGGSNARQALATPQAPTQLRLASLTTTIASRTPDSAASRTHLAVAGPIGPAIVVSASAEPVALSLRDRFRLALSVTSAVAQPFHFRGDAAETGHSADTHCLAQAVYYEARGESTPGQAAVAQVVLNRVRHPAFPKTVCGVVFQRSAQGCQFSFACNGAMHGGMEQGAWRRAEQVAERALGGSVMADVGEATQFQAARAGWASGLMKVAQIGEHVFYRFGGHQGSPGMFHDRAEPSVAPRAPQPSEVRVAALTPNAAPKLTEASMAPVQATSPAPAAAVSPSSAPAIKGGSESVAKPKVQAPVVSTVKTEDTASKSITVAAAD